MAHVLDCLAAAMERQQISLQAEEEADTDYEMREGSSDDGDTKNAKETGMGRGEEGGGRAGAEDVSAVEEGEGREEKKKEQERKNLVNILRQMYVCVSEQKNRG